MTIDDERWALAGSIQLTPAAEALDPELAGVITASPHPTGWFISARYRSGLSATDLRDFAEFVRVRTYLLLANGPVATTWEQDGSGTFHASCGRSAGLSNEWLAA